MWSVVQLATLLILIIGAVVPSTAQTKFDLQSYITQYVGLSQEEIASIRIGQPVAKTLTSRIPAEIFVFGAIYINAPPENYVKFASDLDRLRKLPEYLAIGEFSSPPQLSDLKGFAFDSDDIK